MRITMTRIAMVTAALLLASGAARAQQFTNEDDSSGLTVGVGIICDTQLEAERYVSLRDGGAQAEPAMHTVNDEAKNPRACGLAAVAFVGNETLAQKSLHGAPVAITRIVVVAGYNGAKWVRMPGYIQYAIVEPKGIEI
ncbi:MAG TPA: hypothetical protein VHV58_00225 [Pseudolabrys sp.]|jgi:hypothetical protein|nr:hypothetical protein [Pseudolabrys sp.]